AAGRRGGRLVQPDVRGPGQHPRRVVVALGGAEPVAGRELAARLARWWIATGRYSEAGQFLTTAAGIAGAAAPGIQARITLGTAWSVYHLGDTPRAAPL